MFRGRCTDQPWLRTRIDSSIWAIDVTPVNVMATRISLAPNPESFQVVFSDISMPGMSGLELLDAIEALYPWLPVVLTTGYNDEYARIAQEEASRFVLLQKPYSTEVLALLLQKVVKSRLPLVAQG